MHKIKISVMNHAVGLLSAYFHLDAQIRSALELPCECALEVGVEYSEDYLSGRCLSSFIKLLFLPSKNSQVRCSGGSSK